jgi:hypothetical protein
MAESVETRLARLEERVATLEGSRPGRKGKPILVKVRGVCGVDPESDSSSCPHASVYRRQQGCQGDACVAASSTYYKQYRADGKATE